MTDAVQLPQSLKPADGRFGSGPSKVAPEQLAEVTRLGSTVMGTSHRQAPVRELVGRMRAGLSELLGLPDGYEIVIGMGGSTTFWDMATFSLIEDRAQFAVFGEFTTKFAKAAERAPFLGAPSVHSSEPGTLASCSAEPGIDTYAWAHNETSTGVMAPVERVDDADSLVLVDATSAAAGLPVDLRQTDVYYLAPQKGLASDGGLWLAAMSPAALQRIEAISRSDRWIPDSMNLQLCVENSRLEQTLNTPALATIILTVAQLDWLNEHGGLPWSSGRSADSARRLYDWADRTEYVSPFVRDPAIRSNVVGTIDFADSVDAAAVAKALRSNGIVDTEPYRKLGRNQLRIGMYPAVDPDDVEALTHCIDYLVERLPTIAQ